MQCVPGLPSLRGRPGIRLASRVKIVQAFSRFSTYTFNCRHAQLHTEEEEDVVSGLRYIAHCIQVRVDLEPVPLKTQGRLTIPQDVLHILSLYAYKLVLTMALHDCLLSSHVLYIIRV